MNTNVTDTRVHETAYVRSRCSFVLFQGNIPYSLSMVQRRFDYCRY